MQLLADIVNGPGYKRKGQKYKSLLVWQVLLKRTNEEASFLLKIPSQISVTARPAGALRS